MDSFVLLSKTLRSEAILLDSLLKLYSAQAIPLTDSEILKVNIVEFRDSWNSDIYQEIIRRIDRFSGATTMPLKRFYFVVDEFDLSKVDVFSSKGWEALVSMLILTYPESRWVFGSLDGIKPQDGTLGTGIPHSIPLYHSLPALLYAKWDPIFDGSGLRNFILEQSSEKNKDRWSIRFRNKLALVLEDDLPYCYLHSYSAYRQGFMCYPVTSNAVADLLLKNESATAFNLPKLDLTIEDIYLRFRDSDSTNYSDLKSRKLTLPRLAECESRHFVTSGRNLDKWDKSRIRKFTALFRKNHEKLVGVHWENKQYIDELKGSSLSYKPFPGHLCLAEKFKAAGTGFKTIQITEDAQQHGDHSSPSPIKQVAHYLIERCNQMMGNVVAIEDIVCGAVFANTALELLIQWEPIFSIKALELQHQFEVISECRSGCPFDKQNIRFRAKEIESEVGRIMDNSGISNPVTISLSARIRLFDLLSKIYDDFKDFENLQETLKISRPLQTDLATVKSFLLLKPFALFPKLYLDFLMRSIPNMLVGIVSVLGIIFVVTFLCLGKSGKAAFIFTVSTFFGSSLSENATMCEAIFGSIFIAMGFFHLGVILSHLYSLVSRR